ncbi:hypothetical protein AAY473_029433 [Plecturocebus cupreus]
MLFLLHQRKPPVRVNGLEAEEIFCRNPGDGAIDASGGLGRPTWDSEYFQIADGEAEAQSGEVIFPRPHSREDKNLKLKVRHFLKTSKVRVHEIMSENMHKTVFHHGGQAGLELTSGDPPTLVSQSAGITGAGHDGSCLYSQHFGKRRQVDHLRSGVQDQPGQHGETLSLLKIQKLTRKKSVKMTNVEDAWGSALTDADPLLARHKCTWDK